MSDETKDWRASLIDEVGDMSTSIAPLLDELAEILIIVGQPEPLATYAESSDEEVLIRVLVRGAVHQIRAQRTKHTGMGFQDSESTGALTTIDLDPLWRTEARLETKIDRGVTWQTRVYLIGPVEGEPAFKFEIGVPRVRDEQQLRAFARAFMAEILRLRAEYAVRRT